MKVLKRWAVNVLLGIDQLANTIIGGDPDETISSRAGKKDGKHWLATGLCWILNKIDPSHCRDAIEYDEGDPYPKDK